VKKTTFHVKEMDCSSEEQLIRMRLEGLEGISGLRFDLTQRRLDVFHDSSSSTIGDLLESLNLGARQVEHREDVEIPAEDDDASERGPLMWALAINFTLFLGELTAGLVSGSMGLVADSLDMLADAVVYVLSLAAVGGTLVRKRQLATWSGYLQMGLAFLGLAEVVRRFVTPTGPPEVLPMVVVSLIALAANIATLLILRRTKRGEAHIEASWIFTSNDIKINALVIIAGLLVWWWSSQIPDLVAGGLIFLIVANGSRRILALAEDSSDEREEASEVA